jgi:hypothetical protein
MWAEGRLDSGGEIDEIRPEQRRRNRFPTVHSFEGARQDTEIIGTEVPRYRRSIGYRCHQRGAYSRAKIGRQSGRPAPLITSHFAPVCSRAVAASSPASNRMPPSSPRPVGGAWRAPRSRTSNSRSAFTMRAEREIDSMVSPRSQGPPHVVLIELFGRNLPPEFRTSLGELLGGLSIMGRRVSYYCAQRSCLPRREACLGTGRGGAQRRSRDDIVATATLANCAHHLDLAARRLEDFWSPIFRREAQLLLAENP